MRTRRDRATRPWHLIGLGLGAAALIVLAVTAIGPPTAGSRTSTELVSAADGVVQSTVSGTGNVEAGTDVSVNFQTSGTLSQVYVRVGQHVGQGQLLAELDPTAAQLGVDQAQASLTSAQDQLSALETAAATAGTSTGTSASTQMSATTEFVSAVTRRPKNPAPAGGTHTHTTPATSTPTSTTPAPTTHTSTTPTQTSTAPSRSSSSGSGSGTTTTQATPPSPASIASAQAAVDSAEVAVRSAEDALSKTKLYAPAGGTIVSLASTTPGDTISAGSTGTPSASSGSGGGSGSGGSGGGGSGGGGSGGGGSGGSGSGGGAGSGGTGTGSSSTGAGSGTGSSSSPFAEIVDSSTMTMTVAFSESDITKVHVGQGATVSIDALSGVELAGHVASISTVGTSSNGVVSYDATLQLDQLDPRVRPGMSATATVITAQAQGLTVPLQALTGSGSLATVNVMRSGKAVSQQVVVGLRGDTRAQIVSGLNAGQQLVITITLPSLGTSSGASGTGVLGGGGRFGGGGVGGFGGGAFLRGAGGGGLGGGRGG